MKKLILLLLFPLLLAGVEPTRIDAPEFLKEVKQALPHQGPLRKTSEGFVYVKVPNEYIRKTLDFLKEAEAPAYFGQGMVGAHITVIDAEESKGKRLILPAMGTMISFEIVSFSSIDISNEHGFKRLYMLLVKAPELEKIRADNGLPPKIRGYDFHITVAIELLKT